MPGRDDDLGPPVPELVPARPTLPRLRLAARECRACHLYREATQTVFGEGPARAEVMFVGEQPGDAEDRAGHPFVGPAGRLFQESLEEAGIDRSAVYITNVVKHFKFIRRGKRRIHKKPNAEEIRACFPWLEAELGAVKPRIVVALGAVAAQALLGSKVRVTKDRGRLNPASFADAVMVTVHPSSILRAPDDETRRSERRAFVRDLRVIAKALRERANEPRRAHG
ncbi:MAG TPA: UdgX family uracil-DNA binding protein [Actinomycetota bacterium]|nr:UdgX family uracil-DNA binding protein [Actinomycetota bacterium]